jgi:hypothetical protein
MATYDDEFQRFAKTYADKYDDELEKLAAQRDALTDPARAALDAELSHRNIAAATAPPTHAEPELPDFDRLMIVQSYRDLPQALIAKGALDSAGIRNFLADETMVRMDWFLSNALGGVKLMVAHEDLDAAKEALSREWEAPIELADGEEVPQPRCPKCNSADVTFKGLNKRASIATLAIGLPVPISYAAWHCNNCGCGWEMTEGGEPLE